MSATQQPTRVVNLPTIRPRVQTPGRLGKFPSSPEVPGAVEWCWSASLERLSEMHPPGWVGVGMYE